MKPSDNENVNSSDLKKGEKNPFYEPPFPFDTPEGKALLKALVNLYPNVDQIKVKYFEQGKDLPPLFDRQPPDALWYDALNHLSSRTKLETFLKYLYTENISKPMNELLLSIDSTLTRPIIIIDRPKRRYFFALIFIIIVYIGYSLVTLDKKPNFSYIYGYTVLWQIIDEINSDPYKNNPIIEKYDPNYDIDILRFFKINDEFPFDPNNPKLFFDKIHRANDCLHFTLTGKKLFVTLDGGKFIIKKSDTYPFISECK